MSPGAEAGAGPALVLKYLLVLFIVLMLLVFVPVFSLWLPAYLGIA